MVFDVKTRSTRKLNLLLGFAIALGVMLIYFGVSFGADSSKDRLLLPTGVERLIPAENAYEVRQSQIGADLAPGYTGILQLDGVEIPEDELTRTEALNIVAFTPKAGTTYGALEAGRHTATVVYWRETESRESALSHTWGFVAH